MRLADVFNRVAYKELVTVDLPGRGSNQHEFNGVSGLRDFFRTRQATVAGTVHWHYFGDDREPVTEDGYFTFYDARANHPTRTEWRMYYSGEFPSYAEPGDTLLLLASGEPEPEEQNEIHALIFQQDSGWLRSAQALFEFDPGEADRKPRLIPEGRLRESELELSGQIILEQLGLEPSLSAPDTDQDLVIREFGQERFPSTREMSAFARRLLQADGTLDPLDPDEMLFRCMEREEQLFRALEKVIVEKRLERPFEGVDEFVSFSLSVQNRRKSRTGHALENHLEALFNTKGLRYDRNPRTERKNRPDFLFPGINEYRDSSYSGRLTMLAAKSTCKDRWRQILAEADKIPAKHLCTLDQAISTDQISEMDTQRVIPVIPRRLRDTYDVTSKNAILCVREFVEFVEGG